MEKPKCKLCGERHWGACAATEARPSRRTTADHRPVEAIAGIEPASPVANYTPAHEPQKPARRSKDKAAAAVVSPATGKPTSLIAPPNECAYCDARRAATAAAVKLHRQRKITPPA